MRQRFITSLLLFLGIYLVLQSFLPQPNISEKAPEDFVLSSSEDSYYPGDEIIILIENHLDRSYTIPTNCPGQPLRVEHYQNGVWATIRSDEGKYLTCGNGDLDEKTYFVQPTNLELSARDEQAINYSPWKDELFSELGKYRVTLEITVDDIEKSFRHEFAVVERGFFSGITFSLFFRPIFNLMLFLASIMPGMNLGLAIIAITLIIRVILLGPNNKALKSQRNMMKIQPELDALKKKYAGNAERISQ